MNISTMHFSSTQSSSATPAEHRVVDAAQKFEAILLGEMIKPLREKSELDPDTDSDGPNETFTSYGTEALAQAMVKAGGIGIARQIVNHFVATKESRIDGESRLVKVSENRADKVSEEVHP
jgi:peptidoglycan hydrolase FlgJ